MTSIMELKGKTHMEGEMEQVILKKLEGEYSDLETLAKCNTDGLMTILEVDPDNKEGQMLADEIINKASDILQADRDKKLDASFKPSIPEVPFGDRFRNMMIAGKPWWKTKTSRGTPIGAIGSEFQAFGAAFEIIDIKEKLLKIIAAQDYHDEGFKTPEEFILYWKGISHGKYDGNKTKTSHTFKFKRFLPLTGIQKAAGALISGANPKEVIKMVKDDIKKEIGGVGSGSRIAPPKNGEITPASPKDASRPPSKSKGKQSSLDQWVALKEKVIRRIEFIEASKIAPNPWNPNKMDKDTYEATKDDMTKQGPDQYLDPIQVREVDGRYQIIDGEHRWRIATELGWERIKGEIYQVDETEAMSICYKKNRNRGTLDPYLEAQLLKKMMDSDPEMQQKDLAKLMGVSESHVSRRLNLLGISDEIKEKVKDLPIAAQEQIASIKSPEAQVKAVEKVSKTNGTMQQASKAIEQVKNVEKSKGMEFDNTFDVDGSMMDLVEAVLERASKHPEGLMFMSTNDVEIDVGLDGIKIQPSGASYNIDIVTEGERLKAVVNKARTEDDVKEARKLIEKLGVK